MPQTSPKLIKQLLLPEGKISYELRRHRRAKRLKVAVRCDASVVVTLPRWCSARYVEPFLREKAGWLWAAIATMAARSAKIGVGQSREDYLAQKAEALSLVLERLAFFNRIYGFKYQAVTIRNQKTRWGSCSSRGNLSFNFRLVSLPAGLRDYIIVHELCHLGEHNHSNRFWELVERTMAGHQAMRMELRKIGIR